VPEARGRITHCIGVLAALVAQAIDCAVIRIIVAGLKLGMVGAAPAAAAAVEGRRNAIYVNRHSMDAITTTSYILQIKTDVS
jgi:hypothetical protein